MGHPLLGGVADHFRIGLEQVDPQEPVMVGRLVFRRDTEPAMIRIKHARHDCVPLLREEFTIANIRVLFRHSSATNGAGGEN